MFSTPVNSSGQAINGTINWTSVNYKIIINPEQGIQKIIINKGDSTESYGIITGNKDIDSNGNNCMTFQCVSNSNQRGIFKIIINFQNISKSGHLILMNYKSNSILDMYEMTVEQ